MPKSLADEGSTKYQGTARNKNTRGDKRTNKRFTRTNCRLPDSPETDKCSTSLTKNFFYRFL